MSPPFEALFEPDGDEGWTLNQIGYDAPRERRAEARLSIANGFLGVSGSPPVCGPGLQGVKPLTLVAGLFDRDKAADCAPSLARVPDQMALRCGSTGRRSSGLQPMRRDFGGRWS